MSQIVADIKAKFKETGVLHLPDLPQVRNSLEPSKSDLGLIRATPGTTKFACFQGSKPISVADYALLYVAAVSAGSNAERAQLELVDTRYLKKYYSAEYTAWLALGETGSPWSGPGSVLEACNNKLDEIKELLEKAPPGTTSVTVVNNRYNDALLANGSMTLLGKYFIPLKLEGSLTGYKANLTQAWIDIATDYINTYINDEKQVIKDLANAKFNTNRKMAIECIDNSNSEFVIVGTFYYNRNYTTKSKIDTTKSINIYEKGSTSATLNATGVKKTNVGHLQEGGSQSIYYNYSALGAIAREIASDKTDPDNRKILLAIAEVRRKKMRPAFKQTWSADKVVFDRAALLLKKSLDPQKLEQQLNRLYEVAGLLGARQIATATVINGDLAIDSNNVITQHFDFSSNVFLIQDADENQDRGGGNTRRRQANIKEAMILGVPSLGYAIAFFEGSSSPMEQALLLALQKSLEPLDPTSRTISSKIVKSRRREVKLGKATLNNSSIDKNIPTDFNALALHNLINSKVKGELSKLKSNEKAKNQKRKNANDRNRSTAKVRGRLPLSSRIDTLDGRNSIVNKINSQIREAIIAQMKSPSLINRTGKFASSVKVTSVTDRAVNYSYERNPYAVFSRKIGLGPWNYTKERDPHTIIQRAIRSIVKEIPENEIKEGS